MDLKALIAKMDEIESKKVLTESEDRKPAKKQERDVELPSGSKVKATTVQGWQSQKADKEADKERKKKDESVTFNSTIAKTLMREFGYGQVSEAVNPWVGKDPAKAAAFAGLTDQDQEWLGMADPTDKYILMRAPNKGQGRPTGPATGADMDAAFGGDAGGPPAAPATGAATKPTIDPTKLKRYKELLAKKAAAGAAPAASAEKRTPAEVQASADLKAAGV